MPKNDHIRRIIPLFEQGRIWFPQRIMVMNADNTAHDLAEEFYKQEFIMFPVAVHDDMLDGLSRIVEPDLGTLFPLSPMSGGAASEAIFFEGTAMIFRLTR